MDQNHFVGKVALKAVIARSDGILMGRDPKDPAVWDLPGGRLHAGEDIESGLRREIFEELSLSIQLGSLICSQQSIHPQEGTIHLFLTFEATLQDPDASPQASPRELVEVQWIDKSMLANLKVQEHCRRPLRDYRNRA